MSVSGVVLAAGASLRLGGKTPKQLLDWEGEPLVRRIARRAVASRLAEVLVVVGHEAAAVRAALEGVDVRLVDNPRHAEGQSSSVLAGLSAVDASSGAALFVPADVPHLEAALIDRLIAAWEEGGSGIVLPTWRGRRGAPVLFDRCLFAELSTIRGDEGGRQIFSHHEAEIREVELDSAQPLLDVDTEGDLRGARS